MDDQSRTNPASIDMKDLPPKELGKDIEKNVKGGAEPLNAKKPTPADPINTGR